MKSATTKKSLRGILAIVLALLFVISCIPSVSFAASNPMKDILGTYEGYYYATQGQTGVTLTVYEEDGIVKAIFDFYNLPNKTNAKDGSYYMTVSQKEDGSYYFKAGSWIVHPTSYSTLDITANLNRYVLSGTVSARGANQFYAEKANDSYQNVKDSVFGDHRYEVVDEGMTWTEAEAYAESKGGYLAVITSAEEQEFVQNLIASHTKKQYWIGGHKTSTGRFGWVTGEEFDYTNFSSRQPDNYRGSETVLQMYREKSPYDSQTSLGKWNDVPDDNTISGQTDYYSLSNIGFVIEYGVWSDASQWANDELQDAYDAGLIPDVIIGTDLSQPITRGEFAAVADKLYQALSDKRMIIAMNAGFKDIDNCPERLYILKAFNYAIVKGTSDTTYDPKDFLTREQMATMLTRVYKKYKWPDYEIDSDRRYPLSFTYGKKFADDALISDYAYESVYFMAANHIINGMGNNTFAPRNSTPEDEAVRYANATREQALLISKRTLDELL